jgi:hypothetical protein
MNAVLAQGEIVEMLATRGALDALTSPADASALRMDSAGMGCSNSCSQSCSQTCGQSRSHCC